ncbi:MAG: hypothetical protein HC925_04315 [Coleofasciculaceae cyanobacterium SM2_3_26]|nr:hypothetical protein [Coleofasciculaceae cyanobacterium SM2_3_26]
MWETLFIFILGLTPPVVSGVVAYNAMERMRSRMQAVTGDRAANHAALAYAVSVTPRRRAIGDTTCRYNARSSHLRCAVNPAGPCEGCLSYEAAHLARQTSGTTTSQ